MVYIYWLSVQICLSLFSVWVEFALFSRLKRFTKRGICSNSTMEFLHSTNDEITLVSCFLITASISNGFVSERYMRKFPGLIESVGRPGVPKPTQYRIILSSPRSFSVKFGEHIKHIRIWSCLYHFRPRSQVILSSITKKILSPGAVQGSILLPGRLYTQSIKFYFILFYSWSRIAFYLRMTSLIYCGGPPVSPPLFCSLVSLYGLCLRQHCNFQIDGRSQKILFPDASDRDHSSDARVDWFRRKVSGHK